MTSINAFRRWWRLRNKNIRSGVPLECEVAAWNAGVRYGKQQQSKLNEKERDTIVNQEYYHTFTRDYMIENH